MAASMTCTASFMAGKAARVGRQQQAARPSRALVKVLAASEEDPKFSFSSTSRSARGYTENDSAGQTNIFAVEPKTYVAGSAADTTDASATVTLAAGAFVFAMVAVGAGLVVNSEPKDVKAFAPSGEYKALSEYKAAFVAELSAAPALVEAVAAEEAQ